MEKKLYKDMKNKKLFGVCAGLAKYLNVDVTVVRLITVVLTLCASIGLWAYLIASLILPQEPETV